MLSSSKQQERRIGIECLQIVHTFEMTPFRKEAIQKRGHSEKRPFRKEAIQKRGHL